jgi:membrane-bound lytic murein transglycosylase D
MLRLAVPLAALAVSAACAGGPMATPVEVVPDSPAELAATRAADADPVESRLGQADLHFLAGQDELAMGHLGQARTEFDLALDVLLTAPGGVRADARLSAHFDRLVDRISALELTALAAGDGFAPAPFEPASIDSLLALSTFDDEVPAPELARAIEADLETTVHDIPIPSNDRVVRAVELLTGRLRDFLAEGLARGAEYLPMIQAVFRAEGLPLDLAFVPLIESGFKPSALSRASARGVWQFMRPTGLDMGLYQDWYVDERADPYKSTVAAAKYLKLLHRMFGDWHLALASYNGGPGRVQRAMKRSGRSDFWSLSRDARFLPRETRDYVPMILAAIIIGRNPAHYGFDIPLPPPVAFDRVMLPEPLDLRRVAEWTGVAIDAVRALNPELRRWTTPVRQPDYELKVPAGTAQALVARYAQAAPGEAAALQWHTVRRGETLAGIARSLRVSRADLAEANYLRPTAPLSVGQQLIIPRAPAPGVLLAGGTLGAPAEALSAVRESAASEPEVVVYRVRSGDTLSGIARRHGVTVQNLRAWNGISGSRIRIGDRLTIHQSAAASAQ